MTIRLRAQATLATRPDKHVRALADLTTEWRHRATRVLGQNATRWAQDLTTEDGQRPVLLRADDVPLDTINIQLGGFMVFERELRLASAERSRDWTKERLGTLHQRSRNPIWLVVAVQAVLGGLVGTRMTLILSRPTGATVVLFLLYGLIALVLAFASVYGVHTFRTARG